MDKDIQNPWAGLASYEDPETAERKLKFCGRDDDSYDLARLIMGNVFVTLYGKSGIGKTSLLNAGVFPELREEQYTPVSIRLGMRDEEHPQSYQTMIVEAVERVVKRTETINVIDEQQDKQSIDYLWNYFARHRFYDRYDEPTTPVIVFDQFEEVFRGHRDEAEILLRQLDYLNDKDHTLDSCEVDGQPYRYEQNFRFVVSIREDDLYRLEDSIDNCYLPALKRCRYRLRSLSEEGARDAILIPGEGLFKAEEKKDIADTIIGIARNKGDGSISTNLLSLVCSHIFVDFQKSGADHITPTLVDSFIKGNPFERFYNEATQGFSNREKSYIEKRLVDSTGRRNSISETDFILNIKNGAKLLEGNACILQRISTSSDGGNYRIELIHDSFCAPLIEQKKKRLQQKRIKWLFATIISITCVLVLVMCHYNSLNEANRKMTDNMIHFLSEKIINLTNDGDSYTARRLAVELLSNKVYNIDDTYLPEVEAALRYSCSNNSTILRGLSSASQFSSAIFSPNDKYVLSGDSTIYLWSVYNGKCLKKFLGHSEQVCCVSFIPHGDTFVSCSLDKSIRIWDVHTGKCMKIIEDSVYIYKTCYSPDGKYFLADTQNGIKMYDAKNGAFLNNICNHWLIGISLDGKYAYTIEDKSVYQVDVYSKKQLLKIKDVGKGWYLYPAYNLDKGLIAFLNEDNYLTIWNLNDGKLYNKYNININFISFNGMSFSPTGDQIVLTSNEGIVYFLDSNKGKILKSLSGHTAASYSPCFNSDGKILLSVSEDWTIRIWDISNGETDEKMSVPGGIQDAYFSANGKKMLIPQRDSCIGVYDVASKSLMYKLKDTTWVINASFSPNEKYIASATNDKYVRVWSTKLKKCIRLLKGHTQRVFNVTYSPDGSQIASSSADSTVRIWDSKTGKPIKVLKGANRMVYGSFYSNDGKFIYTMSRDSVIRMWDVAKGKCMKTINFGDHYNQAKLSKDGKYFIVTCQNKIVLWDIAQGAPQLTYKGHTGYVNDFTYYPDSKKIISVSSDGTVKSWDYQSGMCVNDELLGQFSYVKFSPDGHQLTFIPYDKEYVLFKEFPSLQELVDETRERFKNRPLTSEERRKYYLE